MLHNSYLNADRTNNEIGKPGFPVEASSFSVAEHPAENGKIHLHPAITILYPLSGSTIVCTINNTAYTVTDNQVVFINENVIYTLETYDGCPSAIVLTLLESKVIRTFTLSDIDQYYITNVRDAFLAFFLNANDPDEERIVKLFKEGCASLLSDEYGYRYVFTAKLLLAGMYYETIIQEKHAIVPTYRRYQRNTQHVACMIAYISKHYKEGITIDRIASAVNLSAVQCARIFTAATGKTIHQFLQTLRTEEAARLLTETDGSVTDIAFTLGFSSTSHFIDVFRRKMSCTPLAYRAKHESGK